jgi:hypothetical protein
MVTYSWFVCEPVRQLTHLRHLIIGSAITIDDTTFTITPYLFSVKLKKDHSMLNTLSPMVSFGQSYSSLSRGNMKPPTETPPEQKSIEAAERLLKQQNMSYTQLAKSSPERAGDATTLLSQANKHLQTLKSFTAEQKTAFLEHINTHHEGKVDAQSVTKTLIAMTKKP